MNHQHKTPETSPLPTSWRDIVIKGNLAEQQRKIQVALHPTTLEPPCLPIKPKSKPKNRKDYQNRNRQHANRNCVRQKKQLASKTVKPEPHRYVLPVLQPWSKPPIPPALNLQQHTTQLPVKTCSKLVILGIFNDQNQHDHKIFEDLLKNIRESKIEILNLFSKQPSILPAILAKNNPQFAKRLIETLFDTITSKNHDATNAALNNALSALLQIAVDAIPAEKFADRIYQNPWGNNSGDINLHEMSNLLAQQPTTIAFAKILEEKAGTVFMASRPKT